MQGLHYPPLGRRGVAIMVRATDFGNSFDQYYQDTRTHALCIVQIETKEALLHLDEIAGVDGVDVLFIGPADLTMDMGIFGQFDHPLYLQAVRDIVQAADKSGKVAGILFLTPIMITQNITAWVSGFGLWFGFCLCSKWSRYFSKKLDSLR